MLSCGLSNIVVLLQLMRPCQASTVGSLKTSATCVSMATGSIGPLAPVGRHPTTAIGSACVKTQKRAPEFDRELEEFPGKAGSLLMHFLLVQVSPAISRAMFE